MDLRQKRISRLISITVFSILFAVAYKDDSAALAQNRWLAATEQPWFILLLKAYSIAALLLPAIAAVITLGSRLKIKSPMSVGLASLSVLFVFEVIRLGAAENGYGLQMIASGVIFSVFYLVFMAGHGSLRFQGASTALVSGLGSFALVHVGLNLAVLATGMGFHDARFLGTTIHPNFIGVQMAIAAIFLIGWLPKQGSVKLLRLAAIIGALACLLLSGSRTGLVVAGVGFLTYLVVSKQPIRYILPFAFIGLTIAIGMLAFFPPTVELGQFDRGGVDTRAEAWNYLMHAVNAAPFWGAGDLPLASENSYLRGWATVGIAYPTFFVIFICSFLTYTSKIAIRTYRDKTAATFVACVAGLLVGGFLEGFLVDTFTPTLFAFLFSIAGLESSLKGARMANLPSSTVEMGA